MLDGVVAFDLERYGHVPDRLRHAARELESAAEGLARAGHPAGSRAARLLDTMAAWVQAEQARAADRLERITSIPGFHAFRSWEGPALGWEWDVDWITSADGEMHSYEDLVAMTAYQLAVHPVVLDLERGEPLDPEAVDAALAAVQGMEPPEAAALLHLLGADGFRRLHEALAATTDPGDEGDVRRLEDGLGTLTALFASASRAVGTDRLDRRFVDEFVAPLEGALEDAGPISDEDVDAAQAAFARLDFGREVAGRLASVTGPEGAVLLLERAGRPFAVIGALMPLVELAQHGPASPEFIESALTTGLNLAGFLASGTVASVGFFGAGLLVTILFALGSQVDGRPRRRVLSPDAENPGGSHYPFYVDEAGVPATANGV